MISQLQRNPWRASWQFATSDVVLVVLLLGVAVSLSLTMWLPQLPASESDYARWLSETQARFGPATSTLRALGLLTITRSVGFRLLLALLAGCLLVRSAERLDRLRRGQSVAEPDADWCELPGCDLPQVEANLRDHRYRVLQAEDDQFLQFDRWPWADLLPLLAHVGGLLLLVGLLLTHLWGWQVGGLILQPGDRVSLSDTDWLAWEVGGSGLRRSKGVIVHVEQRGPGVQASAFDENDRALSLQQVSGADPVTELTLPLVDDQYFALPESQLIVRLMPEREDVESPLRVQIYRSPPGRLIEESVIKGGAGSDLEVEGVTLNLVREPYIRVSAAFNPGRWPAGIGLVLLVVGLAGNVSWSPRRFWLRGEGEEMVEGAGSLPSSLTVEREDG
jgi:hypothetical protein